MRGGVKTYLYPIKSLIYSENLNFTLELFIQMWKIEYWNLSLSFMVFGVSIGQIFPKNYFLALTRVSKTKQDRKLKPKDLKKILVC